MKEIGAEPLGVGLMEWTNWLAMDQAADLAWNEKLHQMRHRRLFQRIVHAFYPHVANTCQKEKNSVHLDVLLGFNAFATVMQVFKRFPLLHPLQYLAAPVAKLKALSAMEAAVRDGVLRRIQRTGSTEHVDLFDHVLPADEPIPSDRHELTHIGALAQQMMFANYGPISDWYYGTLLFLLDNPASLQYVSEEIRDRFENYEDITSGALASLPYMHACLEESLRLLPSNNTGLPRLSPGAIVDGHYVPKGVRLSRPRLPHSLPFPPLSRSHDVLWRPVAVRLVLTCIATDPCPNEHLRADSQSAFLLRPTILPAAALASL